MTCQECEIFLAQNEISGAVEEHLRGCPECRALCEDLRANALALESMRNEELPRIAVKIPRRRRVYPWIAAAAAAAMLVLALLAPRTPPVKPVAFQVVDQPAMPMRPQKAEPLKIKMLTPDPDVVIYWLIEN
jgi:hypothetical protein